MPIPHFNTAEFFINDNDNDYREYIRILDGINDDIHNIINNLQNFITNNNNDFIIYETENLQLCHNYLFNLIDDVIMNTSINDNDTDELLEYIAELYGKCEEYLECELQSKTHSVVYKNRDFRPSVKNPGF